MNIDQARRVLNALADQLHRITDRDPEQEVRGLAVPVIDEVVRNTRGVLGDPTIEASIRDVFCAQAIAEGEPLRAVDVLLVVTTMQAMLPPDRGTPVYVSDLADRW